MIMPAKARMYAVLGAVIVFAGSSYAQDAPRREREDERSPRRRAAAQREPRTLAALIREQNARLDRLEQGLNDLRDHVLDEQQRRERGPRPMADRPRGDIRPFGPEPRPRPEFGPPQEVEALHDHIREMVRQGIEEYLQVRDREAQEREAEEREQLLARTDRETRAMQEDFERARQAWEREREEIARDTEARQRDFERALAEAQEHNQQLEMEVRELHAELDRARAEAEALQRHAEDETARAHEEAMRARQELEEFRRDVAARLRADRDDEDEREEEE